MSEKETVQASRPNSDQNVLYIVIIVLLLVIAIGAYFLWVKQGGSSTIAPTNNWWAEVWIAKDIKVTIYDDARCGEECQTQTIVDQLKGVPVLAQAEFIQKDFSEKWVKDYLEENSIKTLPAAVFSTNSVWAELSQFLAPLSSGEYSLALGATYDPFIERSANWFLVAPESVLKEIRETAYYQWSPDAAVTWVEYTDVNCGYCQKMEKDGTAAAVFKALPTEFNKTTTNYVGVGGQKTQNAAELLECAWKLGGASAYNAIMSSILTSGNNAEEDILTLAEENKLDRAAVKSCFDNWETKDIVASKFALGSGTFGISGTPGNVIINMKTGEYKVVSWAYPADTFVATIKEIAGN